jgi:hypothetical protein
LKAIDIVPSQHTGLKGILKRAELKYLYATDVVRGICHDRKEKLIVDDDDDEGGDSASDEE